MSDSTEEYYKQMMFDMTRTVREDCDKVVVRSVNTPSASFDGLSDTYQKFMQDVSGVFQIPVSTLYGSIGPHASDGGEDMLSYYAHVERQMCECLFEPFERAWLNIKARAMRRGLYASRSLKPGRHRGRRVKE